MDNVKHVAGEVVVDVKCKLDVDEETFQTCMRLVTIYAKNQGMKSMIVNFPDDITSYGIKFFETQNEVDAAWFGDCGVKESED